MSTSSRVDGRSGQTREGTSHLSDKPSRLECEAEHEGERSDDAAVAKQGDGSAPRRKRRRRALACARCRARKVKCDFGYPSCSRCAKGPWPVPCVYETPEWEQAQQSYVPSRAVNLERLPNSTSTSASASMHRAAISPKSLSSTTLGATTETPRTDAHTDLTTYQARSNEALRSNLPFEAPPQRQLLGHTTRPPQGQATREIDVCQKRLPPKEKCGKKARYHGRSSCSSLFTEFGDLTPLMERGLSFDPGRIRSLHSAKDKARKLWLSESTDMSVDASHLKSLLPPRPLIEKLVSCYFLYHGRMYRVLHRPSFYQEISAIWDDSKDPPPHTIVQLLLVMAIAWCVISPDSVSSIGEQSLSHNRAMSWIRSSSKWLAQNELKRPCLLTFQTRCLLIIAKAVNWTERNQAWVDTGLLVKQAMAAGFHREPRPHSSHDNLFLSEMKRRIWITIVELDLRASFDRGMQPTLQKTAFDCEPPLNINDEAIQEATTILPNPQPLEVATDTCFQLVLWRSVQLRLHICALVNAPQMIISSEELAHLDEELIRFMAEVPRWSDAHDGIERYEHRLWRLHILSNLRRSQISLHGACILAGIQGDFISQSWNTRFEAAAIMLHEQSQLIDATGQLGLMELTDGTLQAVLTVCHHLYVAVDENPRKLAGFGGPFSSSVLLSQIIPSAAESIMGLVNTIIDHFATKTTILTKGAREYALIHMIMTTVKSRLWPQCSTLFERQCSEHFQELSSRVLALLDPEQASNTNNDTPTELNETNGGGMSAVPMDVNTGANILQMNDFGSMEIPPDLFDFYAFDDDIFFGNSFDFA